MRSQRALTIVGLLSVAALAITGCTSAEGNNGEAGDDNYHVYALLPQGTDQPYGTTYLPPMEAKAAELGISLTITNSQYDADRQASECEVAIAAQPDLIILWPAVGDTVRPCLAAAQSAGIPVTVTNSDVNPEDKSLTAAFSGPDTYGQGVASAEIMCDLVGSEEVGILMVNGLTGNSTATTRRDGFVDTVADKCPNVTILAEQPGDWNKDDSQIAVSEMLTAVGPENVQGIYAADDTMVAGAIDALKARGIDPAPLYITSIGNTKLGNPLVISGELDGTVFQSSSWDGENAVVLAHKVLTGESVSDLLMPSVKVTADNASDPSVAPEW
ncbi:MAG TPA: sugar ABC transporter substrate-binding protein [Terrimesophilobacter sp.]|nr:sugar ABC transporter substrate-binding protein [Terrimesophilobacter sp.]